MDKRLLRALIDGFNKTMALKEEHGDDRVTDQVRISLHYETVREILYNYKGEDKPGV